MGGRLMPKSLAGSSRNTQAASIRSLRCANRGILNDLVQTVKLRSKLSQFNPYFACRTDPHIPPPMTTHKYVKLSEIGHMTVLMVDQF
ncbi:MAG: hypothetical protein PWP74_2130 [Shewanella sp.]|nr:hypothetical protein [Shewanella sp.]